MPSPGVFGHRQQLELNKNFCKFLICSICKRKKLSRIEIIRNPLIGFFTFGDSMFDTSMSNPLSGRHFRWRSLRRPRPPVHVSSLRPWIESSHSGWLRLVDLVDSFAGHLSRTFRTAQDLSGTNSWNSCFRKRPKQNDPMNQSKRQTCSSFANVACFLCLMCDSGGVSRSWWIVYREEELKPFFVGLFPKDFDSHDLGTWRLKLCIWYRTTRRACVSPSTTSLRLVLESWQRSGVERQVEGNCP